MNIAFPAIFFLFLIFPGFIFQSAFDKTEGTSIDRKPLDVSFAYSTIISAILHLLIIFVFVETICDQSVNFELAINLITGQELTDSDLQSLEDSSARIAFYFLLTYFLAYVLGKLLQFIILLLNPYKTSRLAFNTPWYYELKGKLSDTDDAQIIKVSCLDDQYIYYGYLEDFYLDSAGQLDRLVLSDAKRRNSSNDDDSTKTQSDRFYSIKGKRLVLKYENIKNINMEYLYMYEKDEPEESTSRLNKLRQFILNISG